MTSCTLPDPDTFTFDMCELAGLVPLQKFLINNDPTQFVANNDNLQDNDLKALSVLVQRNPVTHIDLTDNPALTDDSFVPFLHSIIQSDHMKRSLKKFTLKNCFGLGNYSMEQLTEVCLPKMFGLRHLYLSGLKQISASTMLQLSHLLGERPVQTINFSDVNLPTDQADKVIHNLFENIRLKNLDLSWNCFEEPAYNALRVELEKHDSLRVLNISNTAVKQRQKPNPLNYFLEGIRNFNSVEVLDLSLNYELQKYRTRINA